jgi:hypothetical protein
MVTGVPAVAMVGVTFVMVGALDATTVKGDELAALPPGAVT